MRKAFNFYRSYYEVAKELPPKDREKFLWALLQRQFDGIEPELDGMAKFAYISQQHSIDSQVAGYEAKTKTKLTPYEGGSKGGSEGGSVQEKEKEKEKVQQGNTPIGESFDWKKLLSFINNQTKRRFTVINDKVKRSYRARLKEGYTKENVMIAIINACEVKYHKDTGNQFLTPEFFSRADTLDKYSAKAKGKEDSYYNQRLKETGWKKS